MGSIDSIRDAFERHARAMAMPFQESSLSPAAASANLTRALSAVHRT